MNLNWTVKTEANPSQTAPGDDTVYVIHHSSFAGTSDEDVQHAINTCIDKACDLLDKSIQENSRYFLFGWDNASSTLTILVTDETKAHDSPDVVKCDFSGTQQLDPEDIQYWIKDYLTTCAPFLRYSLIAAFHQESRASCTLL